MYFCPPFFEVVFGVGKELREDLCEERGLRMFGE